MPLYEYKCTQCEALFEKIQGYNDPAPACPKCGGAVEQLMSAPAVQFKGSGWYVTDYARKGATSGSDSKSGDVKASESKSDSKSDASKSGTKSEGKSESKSETKSESKSKPAESKS